MGGCAATPRPADTAAPAPRRTTLAATLAAATVALALTPGAPRAQGYDGTQRLDTFTGPVVSSGRILGLGGAYVAVGEGLGGAAVNPAAVAQRARGLSRSWDWDWFLTWYVPGAREIGRQDLENDGARDVGLSGVENGQVGLSFQRERLGFGVLSRTWTLSSQRAGVGLVQIEMGEADFPVGVALGQDDLVVGASLVGERGVVRVTRPGAGTASVEYGGAAVRLGAILRPRGVPWRLGAALDSGARATTKDDRAALPVATPAAFVFPWTLSLGVSGRLGPNAARWNEPPPFEVDRHPEWGSGPAWEEGRPTPVLVSAQLDVVGPAPRAVAIESALVGVGEAPPSGRRVSLAPRLGAEWEPLPARARVRGGGYLEPSRTGAPPRPHATFGVEARVPFPVRDLQVGLSGDWAARFENVSLSVGFWSNVAPAPPGG